MTTPPPDFAYSYFAPAPTTFAAPAMPGAPLAPSAPAPWMPPPQQFVPRVAMPPAPPRWTRPATGPFRWSAVLPLGDWWRYGVWRDSRLVAFVLAAIVPFLLLQMTASGHDLAPAAWGFAIYFAVAWSIAIRVLVRPDRVPLAILLQIVGITSVVGVGAALLLEWRLGASSGSWLGSIATIGVPEELAKALPLLLVLWRVGAAIRPGTYLYLGVVSGLTFGAVESVGYIADYTDTKHHSADPSVVVGVIWRLLTDSLFHGAMAGICGLFVGLAALEVRQRWALLAVGLAFAAVLHGTYDRFADNFGGMVVAGLTILLFAGYARSGDEIAKRMRG